MLRLHRYLFSTVGWAAFSGVALFVFVLISGNAIRDIFALLADGQITLPLFFDLFLLLIPYAVSFAMPLGILIGILLAMGKLSANNEITAIKSAGVSLWTLSVPVLIVAALGSSLSIYINAYHAPAARANYKAILNDLVRTDPLRFIIPKTFIHDFPGYVLYVANKDRDRMEQFWLWELDEEKRAVRLLRADEGSFKYDENRDSLILVLKNGYTELRDESNPDNLQPIQPTLSFRDAQIRLPLENILGQAHRARGNDSLILTAAWDKRSRLIESLNQTQDPALSENLQSEIMSVQYNMSRTFAMAFSVFSLAVLGIPLGIKASRTETYANIGIALAIALTYYVSLVLIGWTESRPHLRPDLLVWIPNLLCQTLGILLLQKANQH